MTTDVLSDWPKVEANLAQATLWLNDLPEALDHSDPMAAVVARARQLADQYHRLIRVHVTTPEAQQILVVDIDGQVSVEAMYDLPKDKPKGVLAGLGGLRDKIAPKPPSGNLAARPPRGWVAPPQPAPVMTGRRAEMSPVIAGDAWDTVLGASQTGKVGKDAWRAVVGQTWRRPHVVEFRNAKGGVGKTTGACLVASGFGMWSAQPVGLIDNNPSGKLVFRLEAARRGMMTISDVVAQLSNQDTVTSGLWLQSYMESQPSGRFMALPARDGFVNVDDAGKAVLAPTTLSSPMFDRVMGLACEAFRVVVLDGGNNETDDQQLGALRWDDMIVIATEWDAQSCEGVRSLVTGLKRMGRNDLVRSAILMPTIKPATKAQKVNEAVMMQACAVDGIQVCPIPRLTSLADGPIVLARQPRSVQQATQQLCAAIAARFAAKE